MKPELVSEERIEEFAAREVAIALYPREKIVYRMAALAAVRTAHAVLEELGIVRMIELRYDSAPKLLWQGDVEEGAVLVRAKEVSSDTMRYLNKNRGSRESQRSSPQN